MCVLCSPTSVIHTACHMDLLVAEKILQTIGGTCSQIKTDFSQIVLYLNFKNVMECLLILVEFNIGLGLQQEAQKQDSL